MFKFAVVRAPLRPRVGPIRYHRLRVGDVTVGKELLRGLQEDRDDIDNKIDHFKKVF